VNQLALEFRLCQVVFLRLSAVFDIWRNTNVQSLQQRD
jgi:hypothetical protein